MANKPIHHSKTMWFSLVLVILGVVFDNFSSIQNVIDEKYYGISYITIGVLVALLRYITKDSIE
jgi:hypothetical protein